MYIHIAFYVDVGPDHDRQVDAISDFLKDTFGNLCVPSTRERVRRVRSDGSVSVSDVLVFPVRKPVMRDPDQMNKFFRSLETVFSVFDENSPHFTQPQENPLSGDTASVIRGRV